MRCYKWQSSERVNLQGCGQLRLNAEKAINVIFPASMTSSQSSRRLLRLLLTAPAERGAPMAADPSLSHQADTPAIASPFSSQVEMSLWCQRGSADRPGRMQGQWTVARGRSWSLPCSAEVLYGHSPQLVIANNLRGDATSKKFCVFAGKNYWLMSRA